LLPDSPYGRLLPDSSYHVPDIDISIETVTSFKELFELKARTRAIRSPIVNNMFAARSINLRSIESLKNARRSLELVCLKDHEASMMHIDALHHIKVDLSYEIGELKKDTYYLEHGEDYFIDYLCKIYTDFLLHVRKGIEFLDGLHFNCFITDRDGTTNNYCGHYRSSIQPIYNALFLSRFASVCTDNPIILTSAPLRDFGIVDVSVNPSGVFLYAGSKGREFLDTGLKEHRAGISAEKQRLLELLDDRLSELEKQPEYEKFFYIGSGLQFKFGQTTIARQDITHSVPDEESMVFFNIVAAIVGDLDPEGNHFRIEDTGKDIEIILTVESEELVRDYDKGDGLRFIDSRVGLRLEEGPHLVCGDTASDLPMLEAVMQHTPDVYALFVTRDPDFADRVKGLCSKTLIVPTPDILLTILGTAALTSRKGGRKAPGILQ
jgi:hypothetical protein